MREWLSRLRVQTLFIEPGSPWENGYVESLNGKFRDEFLNGEIFYTLTEAKVLVESWRREYNEFRPHSSLGYRPPAPETVLPVPPLGGLFGGHSYRNHVWSYDFVFDRTHDGRALRMLVVMDEFDGRPG